MLKAQCIETSWRCHLAKSAVTVRQYGRSAILATAWLLVYLVYLSVSTTMAVNTLNSWNFRELFRWGRGICSFITGIRWLRTCSATEKLMALRSTPHRLAHTPLTAFVRLSLCSSCVQCVAANELHHSWVSRRFYCRRFDHEPIWLHFDFHREWAFVLLDVTYRFFRFNNINVHCVRNYNISIPWTKCHCAWWMIVSWTDPRWLSWKGQMNSLYTYRFV